MKRILEDYLTIPVYERSTHRLENGDVALSVHVKPYLEPIPQPVPSIDDEPVAYASMDELFHSYPGVDFQVVISGMLLDTLDRAYPTPNNALDKHGFFSTDIYEVKAKEFRQLHDEYLSGLARTILGLWMKEVGVNDK